MKNYDKFKKALLKMQADMEERIGKTQEHIRHAHGPVSRDFSEQASERTNDVVVHNIDELARSELILVKAALRKIENGTYGTCDLCGGDIETERLKALPYTNHCKTCAHH